MGSWNITMGFRRVRAYVSRDGKPRPAKSILRQRQPRPVAPIGVEAKQPGIEKKAKPTPRRGQPAKQKAEDLVLSDDDKAPHVHFDVLLDSGATFPLLHEPDLATLGIDRKTYPAQTATSISTVNGSVASRLYELRATVSSAEAASLVDAANPVHPRERPELGAVVPVGVLPPQRPSDLPPASPVRVRRDGSRTKQRAARPPARLSGILPFMACYASVVPGSGTIWLGEDRRDVLGAHRFPGQRRLFGGEGGEVQRGLREMGRRAPPRVRFEHALAGGGVLVDEDGVGGGSEVRVLGADGAEAGFCRVEPGKRAVVRWKKEAATIRGACASTGRRGSKTGAVEPV